MKISRERKGRLEGKKETKRGIMKGNKDKSD